LNWRKRDRKKNFSERNVGRNVDDNSQIDLYELQKDDTSYDREGKVERNEAVGIITKP